MMIEMPDDVDGLVEFVGDFCWWVSDGQHRVSLRIASHKKLSIVGRVNGLACVHPGFQNTV